MKRQFNLRHRRSNTEQSLNYLDKQRFQSSIQNCHSQNAFSIGQIEHSDQVLVHLSNPQHPLGQRFQAFPKQQEFFSGVNMSVPSRVKQLMKGLKQLIQELCLTKNAAVEIQEELQKIIHSFSEAITFLPKNPTSSIRHPFSNSPEPRNRTIYDKNQNYRQNIIESENPWTSLFSSFLEGTIYQESQNENKQKINTYQEELVQQFMERFFNMLQKQINRITKYNGEKKLRFLLETVMKQVFVYLMRFSYDTRVETFKKQKRNFLNNPSNKIKVFASTIERILAQKRLTASAFALIKSLIKSQKDHDTILVNKFEGRINFLDNLIQIRERMQLRQKFLEWRKHSAVQKQLGKHMLLNNMSQLIQDIIHDFALNEFDIEKWKVTVWTKMNSLMKKLCKFGEIIVFPVDDELLFENEGKNKSGFISRGDSILKSDRYSESFRYSPSSVDSEQNYENQREMFDEINDLFSTQEIKICMKNGQIIMNQNSQSKIILIPIKPVSGIIAIQTHLEPNIHCHTDSNLNQINANSFYTLLNALDLLTPSLDEIVNLSQKFNYFINKIKSQNHHKLILRNLLEIDSHRIEPLQHPLCHTKQTKPNLAFSQLLSFTNRSQEEQKNNQALFHREKNLVDCLLEKLKAKSLIVYHKKGEKTEACFEFPQEKIQLDSSNMIGSEIIEAIMSELQNLNKNPQQQIKCLELKRNKHRFYACPLMKNKTLIGFVQLYLKNHHRDDNSMQKEAKETAFIVKAIDEKNDNFNEGIQFFLHAMMPILMRQKCLQPKLEENIKSLKNSCQHCLSFVKIEPKPENLYNNNQIQPILGFDSLDWANQIFSNYTSLQQGKHIFLQKTLSNFIHKELLNLNQAKLHSYQSETNQSVIVPHDSLESLINRQTFSRIFYLETPITKDGKICSIDKTQSLNKKRFLFSCMNLQRTETTGLSEKLTLQMDFLETLGLFSSPKEGNPQTFETTVNHLIEIYKKMVRKQNSQSMTTSKMNISSKLNSFDNFLEQMVKSIHFRNENGESQASKPYHGLELLLYQLQHLSKSNQKQKVKLVLMITPVFSFLDDKNKYLTAIIAHGKFTLTSESDVKSDIKINESSSLMRLNGVIHSFRDNILSKLILLKAKTRSLQKNPQEVAHFPSKSFHKPTIIDLPEFLHLQKLSAISIKQRNVYNQSEHQSIKIISAVNYLEHLIRKRQHNQTKNQIIPKFKANLQIQSFKIFSLFASVVETKIVDKRFVTKTQCFKKFVFNLQAYLLIRRQKYSVNCLKFYNTMNHVFVINKIFKTTLNTLKNIPLKNIHSLSTSHPVTSVKEFASKRILNIIKNKLFDTQSKSNTLARYAFESILQFSLDAKAITLLEKKKALFSMQNTMNRLICKKAYVPYFEHLERLEKSLSESISLIGTQVQAIDFYSIYQFLRFIHERISIILKSQKKLINVLYGSCIQNVLLEIIVQTKKDNSFFKLSLSDRSHEKLYHSQLQPGIFNKNLQSITEHATNLIEIFQNSDKKLYFSFKFIGQQEQNHNKITSLENLKTIIRKVLEQNVLPSFNKFYSLYEKKIKGFALKLSKVCKIKTHFSYKKNKFVTYEDDQKTRLKKYAIRKLESQIIKINQIKRLRQISIEAQRKLKELQQLQSHYDHRAKKLNSQQLKPSTEITADNSQSKDHIVTRGMIKSLKNEIQNLDQNSESLSIQYQIKSKTVSTYQIIAAINLRERKQALRQVASNISCHPIYCPNNFQLVDQEKTKLKYLQMEFEDEKNHNQVKSKKAATRSIIKVLGTLNKSACKKVFYRINSFSGLAFLKNLR